MDVDCINASLTDDEKLQLMKEGRCFRCKNKGHMSKACPTRTSTSSSSSQTRIRIVEEEEKPKEPLKKGVDDVISSINKMTADEKEDFLAKAFAQEGF